MTNSFAIDGKCHPRFQKVKDAFAHNFEAGLELGSSFAVTVDGEYVVDLWGGYADTGKRRLWERDTITCVYSTTKVMTALCVLILIDRGLLYVDSPVCEYWPEFAQAGKEKITVRQVLSHSSGLSGLDVPLTVDVMCDWEKVINLLELQKPWWEPGSACGYHMFTFGFLTGELVRRVSGKSIGNFFHDEIAVPLNADFFIGLPEECDARLTDLVAPQAPLQMPPPDRDSVMMKTLFNCTLAPAYSSREWRAAEIPSTNGHGNARSAARIGSLLACGGKLEGLRILSSEMIDRAIEEQISGIDLVMGVPVRWGLGFGLASPLLKYLSPRAFYWAGFGGSWLEMDADNRMCFSYVMNRLVLDPEGDRRMLALRDTLFACM